MSTIYRSLLATAVAVLFLFPAQSTGPDKCEQEKKAVDAHMCNEPIAVVGRVCLVRVSP